VASALHLQIPIADAVPPEIIAPCCAKTPQDNKLPHRLNGAKGLGEALREGGAAGSPQLAGHMADRMHKKKVTGCPRHSPSGMAAFTVKMSTSLFTFSDGLGL